MMMQTGLSDWQTDNGDVGSKTTYGDLVPGIGNSVFVFTIKY